MKSGDSALVTGSTTVAGADQLRLRGTGSAQATSDIDRLAINTIRTLAMDAVQKAQLRPSRHADGAGAGRLHAVAAVPALRSGDPHWPNRDRFVLSSGHASMLLYALLHLAGVDRRERG